VGDCLLDSFVGELEGKDAGFFIRFKSMLEVTNIGVALGGIVGLNSLIVLDYLFYCMRGTV